MLNRNTRTGIKCVIFLGTALLAAAAPTYTYTTIDIPGLTNAVATDINNKGQITGYGTGAGGQTGFFDNAGSFTTIFVPGSTTTRANGLNDTGNIVGAYTNSTGSHGFEYSAGT